MLCKKGVIFYRFWEPLGLPVATFLAILGPFWAPSGSPDIQKLIKMLAKTRISQNPLQIRRESTENRQELAANPPRFRREPPKTSRIPAKNQPRTCRTNSRQKLFTRRISMKDFLLRRTLQQKRLESKVGRRCSPLGGLQLNPPPPSGGAGRVWMCVG